MNKGHTKSFFQKIKKIIIGRPHDVQDKSIHHKLSLIAFLAWVGLGADGLSSSCYGPQESFLALGSHRYLSIFVALGSVLTICIISASYSQIVKLFPTGGGGYTVASKLLSSDLGLVSGCALLIDYVLTIAVSVASGSEAFFSLLSVSWHHYRIHFAVFVLLALIILNMRGIKESVLALVPVFLTFLVTHVFIILYGLFTHLPGFNGIVASTKTDIHSAISEIGFFGVVFVIMRAYSMGAGTYTGLEAVSNGVAILRKPQAETAKRTMVYMAVSLSVLVLGLMIAYLLYGISPQPAKTLNAVLFAQVTQGWQRSIALPFIFIALISETFLLFVGAQAGFLDGPRVLANMALDRWFPNRFSMLSDRLVTQNGILLMGGFALLIMVFSKGSVTFLVVLYSINVFITFVISQLGMVCYWWKHRLTEKGWGLKFFVNGIGLCLAAFILLSMIIFKFREGGWITLLITGGLIVLALSIRRHYYSTAKLLHRLNSLVGAVEQDVQIALKREGLALRFEPSAKTAVLLVNGFNGMGLHTLFAVIRLFGGTFKNFVFVQVGALDAGNFKSPQEMDSFKEEIAKGLDRYVAYMNSQGCYAKAFFAMGVDVVEEVENLVPTITRDFKNAVFFGGQLVFPKDTFSLRFLHNYTVFTLQKRLYRQGMPFVILPIRV